MQMVEVAVDMLLFLFLRRSHDAVTHVLVQAGVCTLGERVSMLCSSKAFIFPGGTNEILNKLVFL